MVPGMSRPSPCRSDQSTSSWTTRGKAWMSAGWQHVWALAVRVPCAGTSVPRTHPPHARVELARYVDLRGRRLVSDRRSHYDAARLRCSLFRIENNRRVTMRFLSSPRLPGRIRHEHGAEAPPARRCLLRAWADHGQQEHAGERGEHLRTTICRSMSLMTAARRPMRLELVAGLRALSRPRAAHCRHGWPHRAVRRGLKEGRRV